MLNLSDCGVACACEFLLPPLFNTSSVPALIPFVGRWTLLLRRKARVVFPGIRNGLRYLIIV